MQHGWFRRVEEEERDFEIGCEKTINKHSNNATTAYYTQVVVSRIIGVSCIRGAQ